MAKKTGAKFRDKDMASTNRLFDRVKDAMDPKEFDSIGKYTVNQIKGFTREGKDLTRDRSQPPLAPVTIEHRKYLQENNRTPSYMSPDRSNLTVIGALLNSITHKVVKLKKANVTRFKLIIFLKDGKHPGYKGKSGKKIKRKKPPSFDDIAFYLKDIGREFLGIDARIFENIKKKVVSAIRRNLKRK